MVAHLAWDSRWPGWVWLQGWHQLVEVEPAKPPPHLETPPVECQKLVCQLKFASPSCSGGMFRPSFKSLGRCTNTCPLPFLSKFCVVGAATPAVQSVEEPLVGPGCPSITILCPPALPSSTLTRVNKNGWCKLFAFWQDCLALKMVGLN